MSSYTLLLYFPQAEEMQMSGMVDSLGRKNRYLLKELEEAQRSNEEQYAQLIKAVSERVCGGCCAHKCLRCAFFALLLHWQRSRLLA